MASSHPAHRNLKMRAWNRKPTLSQAMIFDVHSREPHYLSKPQVRLETLTYRQCNDKTPERSPPILPW